MTPIDENFTLKISANLPWLLRYPFTRISSFLEQTAFEKKHVVIIIANHFEPGWSQHGILDHATQLKRLKEYIKLATETGSAVIDADGTKFRHTNFYPAEQYDPEILDLLAEMQHNGLGEVEVHLHHGVERPDTSDGLRNILVDFRDTLAERHKCLSRSNESRSPMYAFVHGNLALANSAGGKYCGVDDEMAILQETGCYADMTLPSAPNETQVPMINKIYEFGRSINHSVPHYEGRRVAANGKSPQLPLIFTGPLSLYLGGNRSVPLRPKIDSGALTAADGDGGGRFNRWMSSNITVAGRSNWVFIKLYCHGFFDQDQSACIGDGARRFFGEIIERGDRTGKYAVHFATAREAFNIVSAAIDGEDGDPNLYRNYRLTAIMDE